MSPTSTDRALDNDDLEENVVDDDAEANATDGAVGAWGSKSPAVWGGAVAVGALGAVVLGLF